MPRRESVLCYHVLSRFSLTLVNCMSSLSQVERAPTNDDGARRACARRNFVSLYYAVMRAREITLAGASQHVLSNTSFVARDSNAGAVLGMSVNVVTAATRLEQNAPHSTIHG